MVFVNFPFILNSSYLSPTRLPTPITAEKSDFWKSHLFPTESEVKGLAVNLTRKKLLWGG